MIDFLHRRALPIMRGEICWLYLIGHPSDILKNGDEKLLGKGRDAVTPEVLPVSGPGCQLVMRGDDMVHTVLETMAMGEDQLVTA
jgi:hypothetical protein